MQEMDIGNHLRLKAELYINDTGMEIFKIHILQSPLFLSYAEQHIVRAMSLLPEYFWYIHLHFVS